MNQKVESHTAARATRLSDAGVGPVGAHGCRVDVVHLKRHSALERYCKLRFGEARPHRGPAREATHLVGILAAVIAQASPLAPEQSEPPDSLESDLDAELRIIEVVERAKAALDAHALSALARMRADAEALVAAAPVPARQVPFSPDELVTMDVATATGLAQGEVGVRLELATGSERRFGRLRQLLSAGTISLRRACEVVRETRYLADDEVVDGLVKTVFAPTRDGAGLSGPLFRQRLRRAILRADADAEAAKARRREARQHNGARAEVFDDGTGTLTIRNDAEKIAAAMDRADTAARAAKAAGDRRSLHQLRADFLTGVAIFGQPAAAVAVPAAPAAAAPAEASPASADAPAGFETFTSAGVAGERTEVPEWFACFGQRPAARVWIVVPITTALGLDDAPCQLPGHGWVSAEQARSIMTAEGSIWHTLLADADTGRALRLSRKGYRPSAAMVAHVVAVDGTCRGPGCTVPASQCDLDHDIPYPEGPTDTDYLSSKHRQHHRVRTAGFWRAVRDPKDASITWRTSAGRRYVTYPCDWLEDVRPRPQVTFDYNPEPFTRPFGPMPDPNQTRDPGPPPF